MLPFSRFLVVAVFINIWITLQGSHSADENFTFVTLIDIVLTDGAKRSCTGTIIHDNVVITAAHCFSKPRSNYIDAELTACFVVIGSKKMFDTGYEQYFPIERVITHPRYKGWTADLALVYTFASMVSDKPGRIVPLASDNIKAAVDANVTVISWGRFKDDRPLEKSIEQPQVKDDSASTSREELPLEIPVTPKREKQRKRYRIKSKGKSEKSNEYLRKSRMSSNEKYKDESSYEFTRDYIMKMSETRDPFKSGKRYRTTVDFDGPDMEHDSMNNTDFDSEEDRKNWQKRKKNLNNMISKLDIRKQRSSYRTTHNVMSYYNNWRRKMGTQNSVSSGNLCNPTLVLPFFGHRLLKQNKLTIEIFGFVNIGSCKKMVEKSKSSLYRIHNGNEVICYYNEDRYVTDADSGAPAMKRGNLVAVTVGGAEFDGDHVAVAMKITCFCSWIAENLPDGGPQMQCCANCCDPQKQSQEFSSEKSYQQNMRKKKKRILVN